MLVGCGETGEGYVVHGGRIDFLSRDGDTVLIPGTIFVLVSTTFFSSLLFL